MPISKIERAGMPGGAVLQVVQGAPSSMSTTSTSYVTVGQLSITPSSTTSKVLVQYTGMYQMSATNSWSFLRIVRDATVVSDAAVNIGWYGINAQQNGTVARDYLDSPNTTSQVTYYIQVSTAYSQSMGMGQQVITLMEIAA